jgi:hypothetical protein
VRASWEFFVEDCGPLSAALIITAAATKSGQSNGTTDQTRHTDACAGPA